MRDEYRRYKELKIRLERLERQSTDREPTDSLA